jgi:hypothetical protein
MSEFNSTEIWRPVVGYEGLYEVSDCGSVRRVNRTLKSAHSSGCVYIRRLGCRTLRPALNNMGYSRIALRKDGKRRFYTVHTLVLEAFVGPRPNGMVCCHGDDNPSNNNVSNLRWDTQRANISDMVNRGRSCKGRHYNEGEDHCRATITEDNVRQIRMARGKVSNRELSSQFGISSNQVCKIQLGYSWQCVLLDSGERIKLKRIRKTLSDQEVLEIRRLAASRIKVCRIAERFGVTEGAIRHILTGRSHVS